MKKFVIIVAGGKGERMKESLPKQFIPLNGKPVLMHTLEAFHDWNKDITTLLVLPKESKDYWQTLCKEIPCKVAHEVIDGGETRFHSVKNALSHIAKTYEINQTDVIAVHDGVRPLVKKELIQECFDKAELYQAVIPAISLDESIREIGKGGSKCVDRNLYLSVQTPQVFSANLLINAYEQGNTGQFTDDASVVESLNIDIHCVAGCKNNIKITQQIDLLLAELMLSKYA